MAGYIHLHLGRGLNHGINLKHAFSTFAFNNLGNITIHNPYGLIYKLPANMFLGYWVHKIITDPNRKQVSMHFIDSWLMWHALGVAPSHWQWPLGLVHLFSHFFGGISTNLHFPLLLGGSIQGISHTQGIHTCGRGRSNCASNPKSMWTFHLGIPVEMKMIVQHHTDLSKPHLTCVDI